MEGPVKLEDLKIVQGHSGRGLQIVCSCGCRNWNHLEMSGASWSCRNCRRLFTSNFPALASKFLELEKQQAVVAPGGGPAGESPH